MSPLLHAVHIATLATWLSVTGFGGLGMALCSKFEGPQTADQPRDPYENLESIVLTEAFTSSEFPASQATDRGSNESAVPLAAQETLPAPPAMPEIAEVTPLPEIPDPPAAELKAPDGPIPAAVKPRPAPAAVRRVARRPVSSASDTGGSLSGETAAVGNAGNGGHNGASAGSDAKRLGGGRMPAPSYPAEARAKGQSGTVVVEFVVGEDGNVISASAKRPSPWPLLNERAVSCVRRWKFPPGRVTKYTRPIAFKLN